jgi:cGMP-specific 3',5'-cyclic phosphodiesterase
MKTVESAILSTDLAMYFKKRDNFLNLIDNGEFDFSTEESKERKCRFPPFVARRRPISSKWPK